MIVTRRAQLEAICRQRGYDLEAAMPCVVSQDGDLWTIDETHAAYPRRRNTPPRRGLGDMVAAGLSAVGITPERVSAALGVKDCGCKKRQQQLNEIGRKFGIG
jgi:hypothetical protein